jgi:hypothetical protein
VQQHVAETALFFSSQRVAAAALEFCTLLYKNFVVLSCSKLFINMDVGSSLLS